MIIKLCPQCNSIFRARHNKVVNCSRKCQGIKNGSIQIALSCDDKRNRERFFKFVIKTTSCWLWNGSRSRKGYGEFGFRNSNILAHRFSWLQSYGSIPKNKMVLHKCDNPPCVNPEHLWIGTAQENTNDMISKGRQKCTPKKLSESQVKQIREMVLIGFLQKELAQKFNVGNMTISDVVNKRRTYARI